jgi:iron complex transport system substrate-binding protein
MTALLRLPIPLLLMAVLSFPSLAVVSVVDDRGQALTLERPAARIVSLAPHVTELLYAAGAGDRIVAVVEYSDYPPAARALPSVGNASRIDLERVIALGPDLVIGWKTGNDSGDLATLERLGIPLFVSEIGAIREIPRALEILGRLAGTGTEAARAAESFRSEYEALERSYAGRAPVSVFYQIWERPLMTINDRHFIADSIRLCGGINVFAGIEPIAPVVSVEAVIAADPAVIVNSASDERNDAQLEAWRRWRAISAVRNDNLFGIPSDLIARPTPRILEGVARLCEILDLARERMPQDANSGSESAGI